MSWGLFFPAFALIFIAELPDKTALATVMMAAQGRPGPIFAGVAFAFVVQTMVAVAFGTMISVIPSGWARLGAGISFLLFALLVWRQRDVPEEAGRPGVRGSDLTSGSSWGFHTRATARARSWIGESGRAFVVIFIAEWGDLTQLASASLVAQTRDPVTVFTASVLALWSVAAIAVTAGRALRSRLSPRVLRNAAALVFSIAGFYFLVGWVRGSS